MNRIPLFVPFLLALFVLLFGNVFFPNLRLIAFAPFFTFLMHRKSFIGSLWVAALCGLLVDVLSNSNVSTFSYVGMTLLLFHQRKNFFEDKATTISLFTGLTSLVITFLEMVMMGIFSPGVIFRELVIMPLLDALYAFLWFTCPMMGYLWIRREGVRLLRQWREKQTHE